MSSSSFFGLNFFNRKDSGFEMANNIHTHQSKMHQKELSRQRSRQSTGNFILMMDLRKKIFTFRDILDLPLCDGTESINELLSRTIKDLHKIQSEIISRRQLSELEEASIDKILIYFCEALKNIGDTWTTNQDWMDKAASDMFCNHDKLSSEKLVEMALATLDCITTLAEEKFDMMDDVEQGTESLQATPFDAVLMGSYSESESSSCCVSPVTPNSVLPSPSSDHCVTTYYSSPVLRSLRVQAVEKLKPFDLKRYPFQMLPHVGALESTSMNNVDDKTMAEMEVDDRTSHQDQTLPMLSTTTELASPIITTSKANPILPPKLQPNILGMPLEPAEAQPLFPPLPLTASNTNYAMQAQQQAAMPKTGKAAPLPLPTPTHVISGTSVATILPVLLSPLVTSTTVTKSIPPPPPPPSPMSSGPVVAPPPPPPPPLGSGSVVPSPSKTSGTTTVPHPPPAPIILSKGSMPLANGIAPPPPPPTCAARSLRPKKAQTKLRRSTQLANLYRVLKGKLEGGNQNNKSNNGRNSSPKSTANGQQGMADALAEITKRSAYFQQIEEDVQKYSSSITELKKEISTFKNNDMTELIKFHNHIESILEHLTDESQVLARFEGFPQKKLEALRSAAALCSKLKGILSELRNWKIETPLGKLLDKAECYFNKIKKEIDALDRTKDEDSKKFQSQNISFDFHILVQIKESMVDVSSNCMELVLKESREAKAEDCKKATGKLLWRAFQFAFRVYTFAGGHDDRADNLTKELAHEIQTDPLH